MWKLTDGDISQQMATPYTEGLDNNCKPHQVVLHVDGFLQGLVYFAAAIFLSHGRETSEERYGHGNSDRYQ